MAQEPITLFARIADPGAVARRLREYTAVFEIDGPDDAWSKAAVTFGRGRKKRTLTFTHDPDYYSEPNWSNQMSGLREYFSQFPETDRKSQAIMLTTTFRFCLGTLFEPDFDASNDLRLTVLFEVTEILDGVLFTPTSLRDAGGRILFGAWGEDEENPDAVWPRVIAEVSTADPVGAAVHDASKPNAPDEQDEHADPPSALRVARRALALMAVTVRAILEQESTMAAARETHRDLLGWVQEIGIDGEIEPDEWEVVQRPLGHLDERGKIDSTWRLEGLAVLAWALGLFEIPTHDKLVKPKSLWSSLGFLDVDAAGSLLESPTLRSRAEVAALRNRLFALHWRLRNFDLNGQVLDFAEFARTCWFGPLDISGLPLVRGDLGLRRKRIDRAPPEILSLALSTARERHQAANWLWEGPERYADASTDT